MWAYTSQNSYPHTHIILHDCIIEKIRLEKADIVFEFVDEYYGCQYAIFVGCIRMDRKPYAVETQIEVCYEESQYYWNKIYQDRTW